MTPSCIFAELIKGCRKKTPSCLHHFLDYGELWFSRTLGEVLLVGRSNSLGRNPSSGSLFSNRTQCTLQALASSPDLGTLNDSTPKHNFGASSLCLTSKNQESQSYVAYTYNPSPWEIQMGRAVKVMGQLGLRHVLCLKGKKRAKEMAPCMKYWPQTCND